MQLLIFLRCFISVPKWSLTFCSQISWYWVVCLLCNGCLFVFRFTIMNAGSARGRRWKKTATVGAQFWNKSTCIAPLPTSPVDVQTSIFSQSVTNNCCVPSCGRHKRKVRGHIKKASALSPIGIDATRVLWSLDLGLETRVHSSSFCPGLVSVSRPKKVLTTTLDNNTWR